MTMCVWFRQTRHHKPSKTGADEQQDANHEADRERNEKKHAELLVSHRFPPNHAK